MSNYECTEESFLDDIKNHEMKIIHDEGVYRHIRFKDPEDSCYWFDITTFPGHLTISGDMGCYVFSRTQDMFNFFGLSKDDFNYKKDATLQINVGYWHEKLQAVSTTDSLKSYDEDYAKQIIREYFEDHPEIAERFIESEIDMGEVWSTESFYAACQRFDEDGHQIDCCDLREPEIYNYRSIWVLYAIAWAIKKYRGEI